MKIVHLVVFFLILALQTRAQAPIVDYRLNCITEDGFWNEAKCSRANGSHFRTSAATASGAEYDLHFVRLNLSINPDSLENYSGEVTSYFKIVQNNVKFITFDLSNSLTVDEIRFRGQTIGGVHENDVLTCHLGKTLNFGASDSLSIRYHGRPDPAGFGAFVADTHHTAQNRLIFTLSEPYGAREWWPSKTTLTDKIDSVELFIRTPSNYRAAANGRFLGETVAGSDKIYHFLHRYPISSYLIGLSVADFRRFDLEVTGYDGETLLLQNYVFPEDSANFHNALATDFPHFYRTFSRLFGVYPFIKEHYGHQQFTWGGGMEHQTLSSVYNAGYELIAHEFAHQWFGDKVTCGQWGDLWLNEGFATFLAGLAYEFAEPQLYYRAYNETQLKRLRRSRDKSVFVADTSDIRRLFSGDLTYAKGSYVLRQLRWLIGDDAFFRACRNYLNDPALAYKYAKTADLRRHFEAASGKNLKNYFDQYVYAEGYPEFNLVWRQNKTNLFSLNIEQTPTHPSVAFFEIPLPLKIFGTDEFGRPIEQYFTLDYKQTQTNFEFELPFVVDSLLLDPDLWLLMGLPRYTHLSEFLECRVAPNPATDFILFSWTNAAEKLAKIELFDLSGRKIVEIAPQFDSYALQYSTTGIAAGIYEVRFTGAFGSLDRQKMIIR